MPEPRDPQFQQASPKNNIAVGAVHYRQLFHWLRMFDLFWISVDLQKLLLAALAVLLFSTGNWCFQQLPFANQGEQSGDTLSRFEFTATHSGTHWPWQHGNESAEMKVESRAFWQIALSPADAVIGPAQILFQAGATWPQLALAWTQLLWALAVWAMFGGAITRIAAVQIGTDRKVNLLDAIKFSARRFLSYFSAPLIPLAGIGFCWGLCLLGGLVGRIPAAGPWIVGLFWGVALLLGFLIALVTIGAAAGWPLMFTTISVEGSDALDGLSRAYGFVFTRLWYYLFLVGIALIFGTAVTYLVTIVADFSVFFAVWGVSWVMGTTDMVENPLAMFWNGLLATLVVAFVHSYFWSAVTMIYFLLRRSVDANNFSDIYLEDKPHDDLLIFAGDEEHDHEISS